MHYITIIICCSFLALCFVVSRNVSRFKKTHGQSRESLLERESEANSVRKADISTLPYIEILWIRFQLIHSPHAVIPGLRTNCMHWRAKKS